MAKLTDGIMGPVKGKIGPVIGSSWKGIPYLKARPRARKRPRKARGGEIGNRSIWAMSQYWLRPLLDFVRAGFKGYSERVEGFIAAKSHLLKNAVEGTAPNLTINPALVQVSFGDLPLPADISVGLVDNEYLQFTWDTTLPADASPFDQVMLLAYDVEKEYAYYTTTGQFRSAGVDTLRIFNEGKKFHIYFAMTAADRSKQSHSVYLGEISK